MLTRNILEVHYHIMKKRYVYEKVQKILKIFLLYKDYSIDLLW